MYNKCRIYKEYTYVITPAMFQAQCLVLPVTLAVAFETLWS